MKKEIDVKKAAKIIFILYSVILLVLLFGRHPKASSVVELRPFVTTWEYIRGFFVRGWLFKILAVVNLVGNVVMFIPLGFFPPFLWKKMEKFRVCFVICAGVIVVIEALQYFTRLGSADIDDFILNSVGVIIGFFLCKMLRKKKGI